MGRVKREYGVLAMDSTGAVVVAKRGMGSLRHCRVWVKESGVDPTTYQPITLLGPELRVKAENVRKVTLVPAEESDA